MGGDRNDLGDSSEVDSKGSEPPDRRWAVGGGRTCDHVACNPVLLGIGGLYDYVRCRRCEAIVVSSLLK